MPVQFERENFNLTGYRSLAYMKDELEIKPVNEEE